MDIHEYKKVIQISDKVLAAILIQKGLDTVDVYQQPPHFRTTYLFWDCRKARYIIKKYTQGAFHFKVAECAEILDELIFDESDRVQYIKHSIEAIHEK